MYTQLIGFLAAIATTLSSIPQVWLIYTTNNVEGLSPYYFGTLLFGVVMWAVYGLLNKDYPIILANLFTSLMVGYIFLKLLS